MRITVTGQRAKGLKVGLEKRNEMLKMLDSTKHYLWHGNVGHARKKIEDMLGFLDELEEEGTGGENVPKLQKALEELKSYLTANGAAHSQLRRTLAE
jgi:hypothetical protein